MINQMLEFEAYCLLIYAVYGTMRLVFLGLRRPFNR